ncbi:MAG TPA: hypothetical protein VL400_21870, partial [Polyangiaceae bacterium]|nr:hypothetical protein [Polyangiaceae bacterium]
SRGRPRDLVWRGEMLAELERYEKRSRDSLAGIELEFTRACTTEASRGRRLRVGLVAAALAVTTGFSIFAFRQWRTAEAARVEADAERRSTEHEKVNVEIRGMVAEARGHEPKGRTGHALALLRGAASLEAEQGGSTNTVLSLELERLARSGAGGLVLSGHSAGVYRVCLPPKSGRVVTASFDETTRVWDAIAGTSLGAVPSQGNVVRGLACSPDGSMFALGTTDAKEKAGVLAELRVDALAPVFTKTDLTAPVAHVTYVDGGKRIVTFGQDGVVRGFDAATGASAWAIDEPGASLLDYGVTPDGQLVVATTGEHVRVYRTGTPTPLWNVDSPARIVTVAISDDGARVAWAVLDGGTVTLADAKTGETVAEAKPAGTLGVAHVGFVPGGQLLVTSGPRGVDLFEASTGKAHARLPTDPAHAEFALSPAGDRIATLRGAAAIDLWDIETSARLATFTGQDAEIEALAFSADGRELVSGSYDKTAIVFDAAATRLERFWSFPRERALAMTASEDGGRIALVSEGRLRVLTTTGDRLSPAAVLDVRDVDQARLSGDGARALVGRGATAAILAVPSGETTRSLDLGAKATALAWSDDGTRAAIGLESGEILIVDEALAKLGRVDAKAGGAPTMLAFSPDGAHLAAASFARQVRIASVPSGEVTFGPEPTTGIPSAVAFSRDGKSAAFADQEKVRWVDVATGTSREVREHDQAIVAVAFSPDGTMLASGSADQTIALSYASGAPATKLVGHTGAVVDLDVSPEGDRILSASEDGTARVWDATLATQLDVLEPLGGRVDAARFLGRDRIALWGAGTIGAAAAVVKSAPADRAAAIASAGARTNLRVCRKTFAVVAIAPRPEASSVWAPDEACAPTSGG